MPQLLDPNSILQSIYGGGYGNLQTAGLGSLVRGNPYIDSSSYYNSLSPDDRAGIDKNGADQGVSGVDWLNRHFLDTMNNGDPVAQAMFKQYGGYSGGSISDLINQANTSSRTANINDLTALGPAARAAWAAANPDYAKFTDGLLGTLNSLNNGAPGPVGTATANPYTAATSTARFSAANRGTLSPQLESDASRLLATNGQLTPGEQRSITEQTMGAYGDRGLADSAAGISALALNSDAAVQARRAQNQQYAQSVAGLNQNYNLADQSGRNSMAQFNAGQTNQGNQYNAGLLTSTSTFNAGQTNDMGRFNADLARNNANDAWGRSMSYGDLLGKQSSDITNMIYGTTSPAVNDAMNQQNSLADLLGGMYNFNANALNANSISNSNNSGATNGSLLSGGAGLLGSAGIALAIF